MLSEPPLFLHQAPRGDPALPAEVSGGDARDAAAVDTLDPSVFLGNLPFTVTETALTDLLQQFGPLEGAVRLVIR